LIIVLVAVAACTGTFDLQIETTPGPEATITALESENAELATQVATGSSTPTPPDLGALAYVQGGDVWVRSFPDGERRRLTTDGRNRAPRWSPTGEWLTFRKGEHDQVWIIWTEGKDAYAINEGIPVEAYAWSPGEDRLAYADAPNGELHVQSAGAPHPRVLVQDTWENPATPPPQQQRSVREIAWSPDGTRIAYTLLEHSRQPDEASGPPSYQGLWVVPVEGGEPKELYVSGVPQRGAVRLFGWTADGAYLLFWQGELLSASMLADGVPLYALPVDGGEPLQLTEAVLPHANFIAPAPTGSRVAVVAGESRITWNNKRLAVIQPGRGDFTYLTVENVAALSPTWSPDGTRLAYAAGPTVEDWGGGPARGAMMARDLWLIDVDGTEPRQLTDDPSYRDERPLWSADGSHMLFARLDSEDRASLWLVPVAGGDAEEVVEELTPAPEWFGFYGHITWREYFDWWRGDVRSTIADAADPTPPTAMPSPTAHHDADFAASRAALTDYEPGQQADEVIEALVRDCANWLAQERDPGMLVDALRALPKLETAEVEVMTVDLNGDDLRDVMIEPQFFGLSVLGCIAEGDRSYRCIPLPAPKAFGTHNLTMQSGMLSASLVGDGHPETVITYTVQGGSGWTELLYAFRWPELTTADLIFHAALLNWAGNSSWEIEPDPTSPERQQMVLTYPHLYAHGFDHKMLNHPLGRQVWRWDGETGQFVLSEREVDLSQSGWGPDAEITVEDRLRWLANEGETAFRIGHYEEALTTYDDVLALDAADDWTPAKEAPDWIGWVRFRHAQTLAYLGRADEARSGMRQVASNYEDDLLGELATAFLSGYDDDSSSNVAATAHKALRELEERLRDHLNYGREGALAHPMTKEGVLCCEPGTSEAGHPVGRWPLVGGADNRWVDIDPQ
jgi:Tol biopolymer transport system component/tetratricopeptide (TPR) repeat protein